MDRIESLNEWLGENELRGLWQGKASLYREPDPFGAARLWKWDTIRAGLEAATELVPTGLPGYAAGYTPVASELEWRGDEHAGDGGAVGEGGESVFAHRHTLAAMRFVIQGSADVCTITDGEKCSMERGDLLVQRNWGWHNHINDSPEHAMWIDCLDTGLMSMLRTEFFESHSEERFQMQHSQVDSAIRTPGGAVASGGRSHRSCRTSGARRCRRCWTCCRSIRARSMRGCWSTGTRRRAGLRSRRSRAGYRCWSRGRKRRRTGIRQTTFAMRLRDRGCRRWRVRRWCGKRGISSWCQLVVAPAPELVEQGAGDYLLVHGQAVDGGGGGVPGAGAVGTAQGPGCYGGLIILLADQRSSCCGAGSPAFMRLLMTTRSKECGAAYKEEGRAVSGPAA